MNQPQKPKDQPKTATPAPEPAWPPQRTGGEEAEPKGQPNSDRHKTETAGEPEVKG